MLNETFSVIFKHCVSFFGSKYFDLVMPTMQKYSNFEVDVGVVGHVGVGGLLSVGVVPDAHGIFFDSLLEDNSEFFDKEEF